MPTLHLGIPSLPALALCALLHATLPAQVASISCPHGVACDDITSSSVTRHHAIINVTYVVLGTTVVESDDTGNYGMLSRKEAESGVLVHYRLNAHCIPALATTATPLPALGTAPSLPPPLPPPQTEKWVALVDRGECSATTSSKIVGALRNASAVVIYSEETGGEEVEQQLGGGGGTSGAGGDGAGGVVTAGKKHPRVEDGVYVFISPARGSRLAHLVDNGTRIHVSVSVGETRTLVIHTGINRTSMLFLSVSFIVLMVISLAWLVFYYVQRSRHTYAKQRLSRRLMSAAKKAITKMPLKTVRSGEEHQDAAFDLCAICIEGYRNSDVARILPCKHVFHKHCIDPWLIEQRNCPICKTDILKALGLQIYRSRESALNVEPDLGSASYGYSEFGPLDSGGGGGRDFDSDGVEIVRFQLAQIECHTPAAPPHAPPAPLALPHGVPFGGCCAAGQAVVLLEETCAPGAERIRFPAESGEDGAAGRSCFDPLGAIALGGDRSDITLEPLGGSAMGGGDAAPPAAVGARTRNVKGVPFHEGQRRRSESTRSASLAGSSGSSGGSGGSRGSVTGDCCEAQPLMVAGITEGAVGGTAPGDEN